MMILTNESVDKIIESLKAQKSTIDLIIELLEVGKDNG